VQMTLLLWPVCDDEEIASDAVVLSAAFLRSPLRMTLVTTAASTNKAAAKIHQAMRRDDSTSEQPRFTTESEGTLTFVFNEGSQCP
jgi:hypothetical protein